MISSGLWNQRPKEDEEVFFEYEKRVEHLVFSRIAWWPAGLIMINKLSNKLKIE